VTKIKSLKMLQKCAL